MNPSNRAPALPFDPARHRRTAAGGLPVRPSGVALATPTATPSSPRETLTNAAWAIPPRAMRFAWVDIEDESELVGDLDIEDFPTLLLAREDRRFCSSAR